MLDMLAREANPLETQDGFLPSQAGVLERQAGLAQVLLVEPNAALRSAISSVLAAERYEVQSCDSLEQALERTDGRAEVVALVAWQSMQGLLTDERRPHLVELTRRLKLVLLVPRRWARLIERTDLSQAVAGLIPKPVDFDELLGTLQRVLPSPLTDSGLT